VTGISAHVPGLVRQTPCPRPLERGDLTKDFAGLLEMGLDEALGPDANAHAFNENGLFGRAITYEENGREQRVSPPVSAVGSEMDPACEDRAGGEQAKGETVPMPQWRGNVTGPVEPVSHHPITNAASSVSMVASTQVAAAFPSSQATTQADPGTPLSVGRGNAMVKLAPALPRPAPSSNLQASINVQAGLANVLVRGEVSLGELEAKLKQTLAEFDLDLASLRFNGTEQPFTFHFPGGDKYGDR